MLQNAVKGDKYLRIHHGHDEDKHPVQVIWQENLGKRDKRDSHLLPGSGIQHCLYEDRSLMWFSSITVCWPLLLTCSPGPDWDICWTLKVQEEHNECHVLGGIAARLGERFFGGFFVYLDDKGKAELGTWWLRLLNKDSGLVAKPALVTEWLKSHMGDRHSCDADLALQLMDGPDPHHESSRCVILLTINKRHEAKRILPIHLENHLLITDAKKKPVMLKVIDKRLKTLEKEQKDKIGARPPDMAKIMCSCMFSHVGETCHRIEVKVGWQAEG